MTDDLDIPAFLRITKDEQAARDEANKNRPAPSISSMVDPRVEEQKLQREAERKDAAHARIAKMKARMASKQNARPEPQQQQPGQEWINGRWQDPDTMSRANFDRILAELPTASMKKLLKENYSQRVRGGVRDAA